MAALVPTAAQALGPSYTGRAVQDAVTIVNYDPRLATAAHVPFEVQCEVLNLNQIVYGGACAFQVFNSTGVTLQPGPVNIAGFYGLNSGAPIYTVSPAAAGNEPAHGFLLAALAANTGGAIYLGGAFVSSLNTLGAQIGDKVYLGGNGGLSLSEPEDALFTQRLGWVQTLGAAGTINGLIQPAVFRAAAVPDESFVC